MGGRERVERERERHLVTSMADKDGNMKRTQLVYPSLGRAEKQIQMLTSPFVAMPSKYSVSFKSEEDNEVDRKKRGQKIICKLTKNSMFSNCDGTISSPSVTTIKWRHSSSSMAIKTSGAVQVHKVDILMRPDIFYEGVTIRVFNISEDDKICRKGICQNLAFCDTIVSPYTVSTDKWRYRASRTKNHDWQFCPKISKAQIVASPRLKVSRTKCWLLMMQSNRPVGTLSKCWLPMMQAHRRIGTKSAAVCSRTQRIRN